MDIDAMLMETLDISGVCVSKRDDNNGFIIYSNKQRLILKGLIAGAQQLSW